MDKRRLFVRLTAVMIAVCGVIFCLGGCAGTGTGDSSVYTGLTIFEDDGPQTSAEIVDKKASSAETAPTETTAAKKTGKATTEKTTVTTTTTADTEDSAPWVDYKFRNKKLLDQHYEKHGRDMGFESARDYEESASEVANDPSALHKTEAEDGDDIYYIEATNEFVVISTDGYIRTYFLPDKGKAYYDRQ
ncbi:MAG: hypothetical protein IJ806_08735 [Ruminococcus sp.]|nr:hypothetical protein [Ruminococcus sp.]